jgi:uncharacterized SAM-binding protein YcdF (DUF218 family)
MKDEYVIRIHPRRWLRGIAIVLVLLLTVAVSVYLARGRILTWVGAQLVHVDRLEKADAIVVLAGGSPEREIEAADLYTAGWAPRIVITREPEHSGVPLLKARGIETGGDLETRLRYFRELRVPVDAVVVLDGIAESTEHESRLLLAWARGAGIRSAIVVSSMFHTGRARLILARTFRDTNIVLRFRGASSDAFTPETWWQNRVSLRNGVIEYQKQIYQRLFNW